MPGPQVKNWPQYEKLRAKGFSKQSAARITNASAGQARQLARRRKRPRSLRRA
jgi:hypothetical protein